MDSILPECFSLVMYHALAGALPCPLHDKPVAPVTYPITVRGEPTWITTVNASHATVRDHTAVALWVADLRWAARRLAQLALVSSRWRAMLGESWRGLHDALLVAARTERVADLPVIHLSYALESDAWRQAVKYAIQGMDYPLETPFNATCVGTLREVFDRWRPGFVCSASSSEEHLELPLSSAQERANASMDSLVYSVLPWPSPAAHRDVSLRIIREQEDEYYERRAVMGTSLEALGPWAQRETRGPPAAAPMLFTHGPPATPAPRLCRQCYAACFIRISHTPKNPGRPFWVCPFRCRDGAWIGWATPREEALPPPTIGAVPSEFTCARCRAIIDPYEQGGRHAARYAHSVGHVEMAARTAVSAAILAGTYVCEQCLGR
jgi:hypothetical protein